jgi:NAD(P)-dependent dehydrogenase (short-subunit alcohol dehydrogenase family)
MERKLALVTGATSGVGKKTAAGLLAAGFDVAMLGRDPELGAKVQAELLSAAPRQNVSLHVADLADQAQIRRVAAQIRNQCESIDVIVNNAGAVNFSRIETADGFELTFAVNHLAHFLLTGLLLDLVRKAPAGRIVNVASKGHAYGNGAIDFADLDGRRRYNGMQAYFQSKLANVLFTYELARRIGPGGATVNALHPGDVGSNFAQNNRSPFALLIRLARPFLLTSEQGAETSIYLATSPEVAGMTGGYYVRKRAVASSPQSMDVAIARQLWEISEERTGRPFASLGVEAMRG